MMYFSLMILVTGGTGLLGTYILYILTRNNQNIRALIRKNSSKKEVIQLFKLYEPEKFETYYNRIEWIEGDVTDIYSLDDAMKNVEYIYHSAAYVSFDEKQKKEIFKVNVEGTKNIVNAALSNQIKKLCFISSIAAIGTNSENRILTEKSQWNYKNNLTSYANSKYMSEIEVWRASQEGLNVIILNPGIILGSGNFERNLLFKWTTQKKAYATLGFAPYVDAKDVANIAFNLMNSSIKNERFIISSENLTYYDVVNYIREFGNLPKAKKISNSLIHLLGFFSKLLPIKNKLKKPILRALVSKDQYSNDKIKEFLHYQFTPIKDSLYFHTKNYLNYKNTKH